MDSVCIGLTSSVRVTFVTNSTFSGRGAKAVRLSPHHEWEGPLLLLRVVVWRQLKLPLLRFAAAFYLLIRR